ncbi:predicted protein [Nematostella vectensis]|uniref:Myotubularin phosphatase domain-containing protein n=1 Tax=Nematostella vectensis TaxID=45351 RepID=A7SFD9_NEMVE|nr:predicted protein [Nematostella vectensis]|eukprot:XP_001629628.1 predicted protein [Nematostella vectensis]
MVARARNVLRFSAMAGTKSGVSGTLYVTNFRVSFLVASSAVDTPLSSVFQSNPDLTQGGMNAEIQQELHIPLTCILELSYSTSKSSPKLKKLMAGKKVSSRIQVIQVQCKDFRVLQFGFKFTPKEELPLITNALGHYAFPSSVSLLFAFQHSLALKTEKRDSSVSGVIPTFRTLPDWLNELSRLNVDDTWRVALVNEKFHTCPTLPQRFVCLASLTDSDVNRMSLHYEESRFPLWCWSHPKTRVPIMLSASGRPESIFLEKEETSLFRALSSIPANPEHKDVKVVDLSKICPSIQQLSQSYLRVRELCVLDTTKNFWSIDPHWLSSLDNSRWLASVRTSISTAVDVCKAVCEEGRPVIVKEASGRDLVLVVCSLAQLMLDQYYRNIRGFQTLIQKMWVLGGHPFMKRCGHIKPNEKSDADKQENEESPVFLHFLDCVYQLITQFPSEFEFSETYLLGMLDSMHACLFDEFLFDCEHQRQKYINSEFGGAPMASLWDFLAEQLSDSQNTAAFINPLNEFKRLSSKNPMNGDNEIEEIYSRVNPTAPAMKFWSGCYLRWLPTVHLSIGMGENSSLHMQQMIVMNEVKFLTHKVAVLNSEKLGSREQGHGETSDTTDWGLEFNFSLDLETSKLLTPSMPFIGDLALSNYYSGQIPQPDLDKSVDVGQF